MTFPTQLRPAVGQSLITKVSRLFNGTISDVLAELLQNARRANATAIYLEVVTDDGSPHLLVRDDGDGIDDPNMLLTLGQSGWGDDTARREDPAGMGVFSLAGHAVTVQSYSITAGRAWKVHLPQDGWEGAIALPIEQSDLTRGTLFDILLPDAWSAQVEQAARAAALHYPLPVWFDGEELDRKDFLAGAVHVEHRQGCRIGIFADRVIEASHAPRINFHGVTVPCRLPTVSEVDRQGWRARVDIIDAPALQLVLPARKEMVENPALDALRRAVKTAIFRAVSQNATHRLSFKSWTAALDLGIALPEADPWLSGWLPITADSRDRYTGDPVRTDPMVIMPAQEAHVEQALARAFGRQCPLGGRPVLEEPSFSGYSWYDSLQRAERCVFTIERDGVQYAYGADDDLPEDISTGAVTSITAEIPVLPDATEAAEAVVVAVPCDALACTAWSSDVDDAVILFVEGASLEPADFAWFIDASLFSAADDGDCDSWETQQQDFSRQSRNLANRLLLGEEAALAARIRSAFLDHVGWLIPAGRALALTSSGDALAISLAPAA